MAPTSRTLIGALTTGQVLLGCVNVLGVFGLLAAGTTTLAGAPGPDVLLLVLSGLYAAATVLALILSGWAKGWIARLTETALGLPTDPQLSPLRLTLDRWLPFLQRLGVALAALLVMGSALGGGWLATSLHALDSQQAAGAGVMTLIMTSTALVAGGIGAVLN
ncbi:hypothetical protein [Deinococcus maricopensis]|uniref:Uncharacterized protein n=1 Tax=Deinococcus maricopensis (strain DSM 21211 / LMG 22137 / NRRL B-23946 / LB-34) TaxID=709986 RepID=E8U6J1_DEIML|nr:hypothetical protein [Deinococcus maricopensis]ADV66680.1 hypothetical protein Deima_1027 [Deinococcus maricopensis DSM 21211]